LGTIIAVKDFYNL